MCIRDRLYVVGLGPGDEQNMTGRALAALEESEVIVGYTAYVDLIRARYPEKAFLATAMRGEVERCRMALEAACGGRTVAVVSSGDAGVYGMAGLVYELAQGYDPIDIEAVSYTHLDVYKRQSLCSAPVPIELY